MNISQLVGDSNKLLSCSIGSNFHQSRLSTFGNRKVINHKVFLDLSIEQAINPLGHSHPRFLNKELKHLANSDSRILNKQAITEFIQLININTTGNYQHFKILPVKEFDNFLRDHHISTKSSRVHLQSFLFDYFFWEDKDFKPYEIVIIKNILNHSLIIYNKNDLIGDPYDSSKDVLEFFDYLLKLRLLTDHQLKPFQIATKLSTMNSLKLTVDNSTQVSHEKIQQSFINIDNEQISESKIDFYFPIAGNLEDLDYFFVQLQGLGLSLCT